MRTKRAHKHQANPWTVYRPKPNDPFTHKALILLISTHPNSNPTFPPSAALKTSQPLPALTLDSLWIRLHYGISPWSTYLIWTPMSLLERPRNYLVLAQFWKVLSLKCKLVDLDFLKSSLIFHPYTLNNGRFLHS